MYLRVHGILSLQDWTWVLTPWQVVPWLQWRRRSRWPPLHVALQALQEPQFDHSAAVLEKDHNEMMTRIIIAKLSSYLLLFYSILTFRTAVCITISIFCGWTRTSVPILTSSGTTLTASTTCASATIPITPAAPCRWNYKRKRDKYILKLCTL